MNRYQSNRTGGFETYTMAITDYGPNPFVANLKQAAILNDTYRTALWTGKHLQLTLMDIIVGGDVGLEVHPEVDQFFLVEAGKGEVMMGPEKDMLTFKAPVQENFAIFIPAGTWHNVVNTGATPLKLVSIYAPPNHPAGTVQKTKEDAERAEYSKLKK